jgi:2-dehydro-3-deoxygalactonokinase
MSVATWVAVDWGTTHVRGYAMQGAQVLDKCVSDQGMARLSPADFEQALEALIVPWALATDTPVVACGMVGARQGWIEAPYRTVPCAPFGSAATRAPTRSGRAVHIISGLAQQAPADVMRGEETQIAGFLALNPGWDGVICLPGTHTKWAEISAGEVVSFQTYMTGEMFALLAEQSVLRHSIDANGWDADAFDRAVTDAMAKPERLAARLFGLRAANLLHGVDAGVTRAQLSGYLIGAEMAAARPYWLGRQIALLGGAAQTRAYAAALQAQGVPATIAEADRMTLAGLTAAWRSLKEIP